jgi:hypothetical protein
MWDPQPLTAPWAFTACYRESFTWFALPYLHNIHLMMRKCNNEILLTLVSDFIHKVSAYYGRHVSAVHFPINNLTDIKEMKYETCVANAGTVFYIKKAAPASSL